MILVTGTSGFIGEIVRLGRGVQALCERFFSGPALEQAYADLFREVAG